MSMRRAVRKLDCQVKERKGQQACFKMGVFPKERGHAGRGQGLLDSKASRDVISLWGGSGVVAKGSPNKDQESGEPRLSVLFCKTPNLYKQFLLGTTPHPPHFGAHGRRH